MKSSIQDKYRARNRRRSGFTLIELMVVLAIAGALISLTAAASIRFISVQHRNNTENTITKVWSKLNQHWSEVAKSAFKEPIPSSYVSTVNTWAGNDSRRARVIWVKWRLKQAFPMSIAEIQATPTSSWPLPALTTYANAVAGISSSDGFASESSACLLLALSQSRGGIAFNPDDIGPNALSKDSTNNLQIIVDGWGTPIRFYRWPFGNLDVDQLNPAPSSSAQQTFRDPQDPEGLLMDQGWWNSLGPKAPRKKPTDFELGLNLVSGPLPTYPDTSSNGGPWSLTGPASYYMVPVIASAGADQLWGLDNTSMGLDPTIALATATAQSNDNIYSYRIRLGGSSN